jgi:hypothetical protein
MRLTKLVFTLIFMAGSMAGAQSTANMSVFSKKQQFDTDGTELYNSNLDLKKHKTFGFGTSLGGTSGAFGVHGEINLEPENTLVIGVGTGPSYGTFEILWKNSLMAHYLSPYSKLGYSKWFSVGGGTAAGDSGVLRQIYSEQDLRDRKFGADFLVGAIGAEYNQLEGELSGVNFFGELALMGEVRTARLVPTGSIGITYFY